MSSVESTNDASATTDQSKRKPNARKATAKRRNTKQTKPAADKKQQAAGQSKVKKEKPAQTRQGSKTEIILQLLRRKEGATIAQLAKATDWQNHSVRGFISGTLTKKMGLTVESTKSDANERTYRITT